jgi:uncharacterized protein YeaC (DUF1315 family)
MDYQQLIDSLSPDVVDRLRRGVETGRWPDGRALTPEQREHSLQAIIAWDQRKAPAEQRVGYIDKGRKAGKDGSRARDGNRDTLRWVGDSGDGA